MVDALIQLIERLSELIERENNLLDAFAFSQAGALVGEKLSVVTALQAAALAVNRAGEKPDGIEMEIALRKAVERLEQGGEQNRVAIERSLALQMQLIRTIADAVPRARASESPAYQQDGSQIPLRPPEAYAFLSRM